MSAPYHRLTAARRALLGKIEGTMLDMPRAATLCVFVQPSSENPEINRVRYVGDGDQVQMMTVACSLMVQVAEQPNVDPETRDMINTALEALGSEIVKVGP